MIYNYVEKIGGTDSGIHLVCPKCEDLNVVIVVSKEGNYGVEECKKCGYKNVRVKDHLNGKSH